MADKIPWAGKRSTTDQALTLVEELSKALGKPTGLVATTIGDIAGLDTPSYSDILSGDKQYYYQDLAEDLAPNSKVASFVGGVADVLLDPLNLVGGGAFKAIDKGLDLVKAGKAGAKAAKGVQILDKFKYGRMLPKAAATGAGVGLLASDSPEEMPENIIKYGTGAGLLAPFLEGASAINKAGTKLVDYATAGAKPEVFNGSKLAYSEAKNIHQATKNQFDEIARGIIKRDDDLGLYNLSEQEAKNLASTTDEAWMDTISTRNKLMTDRIKYRLDVEDAMPDVDELADTFQAKRKAGQKFGDRIAIRELDDGTIQKLVASNGSSKFEAVDKAFDSVDDALKGHVQPAKVNSFNDTDAVSRAIVDSNGEASTVIDQAELNKFNTMTNNIVGNKIKSKLAEIGNPELTDNVAKFVSRNRAMIDDYNKAMLARHGDDYTPTVPLDFHTLEVKPMESIQDVYKAGTNVNLREGLVKRTSETLETGGLSLKERLQLEAERFPIAYMTKTEKEARRIVNGVKFTKLDAEHPLKFVEKTIDKWDEFTNFLKQQQLTFSHSWIVNNATENLTRAYLQNGLTGLMRSASDLTSKKMWKQLLSITDPKLAYKKGININDTLFQSALNSGAISEGFFGEAFRKGHLSKNMLMARVGTNEAKKTIAELATRGNIARGYDRYRDYLKNSVGRMGQIVENSARMTVYTDTINNLIKNPNELKKLGISLSPKKVKELLTTGDYYKNIKKYPELRALIDKATKVVNDTFFDYGNISVFEDAVMKRMFPYWTFFSKNTKYWADKVANDPRAIAKLFAAHRAIGREPTDRERKEIPDYLRERGAKISRDGSILTAPNVSLLDFLNTLPTNVGNTAMDRAHPIIGLMSNIITQTDDFGQPLLPSQTKSGRKRVYSGGLKLEPFNPTVFRDATGKKVYTDSDATALVNELQSALLPVPIVDTGIRIADELINKDQPLADTLLNLISPVKSKNIDTADKLRARKFRESDEKRTRRNLRETERMKRLNN